MHDQELSESDLAEFRATCIPTLGSPLVDFKQYLDRTADALKLTGAGNATGLIAVGTAFTSGKLMVMMALLKWCTTVFFIGVVAFAYSYWCFYIWFGMLDEVSGKADELKTMGELKHLRQRIHSCSQMEGYWKSGALISLLCFAIGCAFVLIGILTFH